MHGGGQTLYVLRFNAKKGVLVREGLAGKEAVYVLVMDIDCDVITGCGAQVEQRAEGQTALVAEDAVVVVVGKNARVERAA